MRREAETLARVLAAFLFSFSSQTKHQPLRLVGEPFHGRKEVLLIAAAVWIFCQVLEPVPRKSP